MSFAKRFSLATMLLVGSTAFAQNSSDDKPQPHVPLKAATKQELDHAEALKLYARAVMCEQDSEYLEAIKAYEAALRLEPDAPPLHKAIIPLYFAVERTDEAFAACQRVLELDPADYDTAALYARRLKAQERLTDAVAAFHKAVQSERLKERPDFHAQILFDLAVLEEDAGHLDEAEKALRQVAELLDDPNIILEHGQFNRDDIIAQCADTWERLGRVRLRANKPADAVLAFQQAGKKDPTRAPRLAYNMAEVYTTLNKPEAALEHVNEYLRQMPSGMEAYELKIKLLKKLNREKEIVANIYTAAQHDPQNVSLQLLLAREYRNARQPAAAEQLYQRLTHQQPTPAVFKGLLELYREDTREGGTRALTLLNETVTKGTEQKTKDGTIPGDATEASKARAILAGLRDEPKLVQRMLEATRGRLAQGGGLSHQTRALLAALAARTRQLDDAEQLYRSCLNQPALPAEFEHEVYSGLLQVLSQAHKYAEIVKVCNQGLEKAQATNRVLFHIDLAYAYLGLDDSDKAIEAANAAVNDSSDRERPMCRRIRVGILSQCNKQDEAIAECQALLKEYNQNEEEVAKIRAALSMAYSAARKYDESEQELQKILEANPNDATANNDLGYQWADRNKNLPEAEKLIRRALELDKQQRNTGTAVDMDADQDNAAYVDSLGWVLFRLGKLDEAKKELERAVVLADGVEDPTVWDHLGDVYFRLELKAKAAAAWQKSLKLYDLGRRRRNDGRYEDIKKKLKLLEP
jgi:tetratricopeptide (TPR) repeat protein